MKKDEQTLYVSPQVKTVEIKTQTIICQSGRTENSLEGDTTDWWDN